MHDALPPVAPLFFRVLAPIVRQMNPEQVEAAADELREQAAGEQEPRERAFLERIAGALTEMAGELRAEQ